MLTCDDRMSFYLMPDCSLYMHRHKIYPSRLHTSEWMRVCSHCGLRFTFPWASGIHGKKTVSKTAEHLAEHVKHTGGFTSKCLMMLIEEGVRMRTRTLPSGVGAEFRIRGTVTADRSGLTSGSCDEELSECTICGQYEEMENGGGEGMAEALTSLTRGLLLGV